MRETLDIGVTFRFPRDLLVEEAKEVSDEFLAGNFVDYLNEELGPYNPDLIITLSGVSSGEIE
jgi:hypothetical protein